MAQLPQAARRRGIGVEPRGFVTRAVCAILIFVFVVRGHIICGHPGYSRASQVGNAKQRVFFHAREIVLSRALRIDDDRDHLVQVRPELLLQQTTEVIHLVFVDGHDQDAIVLQQPFGDTQSPPHERQPFAVAPAVLPIHVVIVVFPVARAPEL